MTAINYFNFKKFKEHEYLLTNDAGRYLFLNEGEFEKLLDQSFKEDEALCTKLESQDFATAGNKELFVEQVASHVQGYKNNLFQGTGLHIFVVTTKCNQRCIYCQASVKDDGLMMCIETAQKAVDLALQSPNKYLTFEFQGGEPLLNFEVIKWIVEYTEEKKQGKVIAYNLVSNLTQLTEEIAVFLKKYHVNISTSLDGNEILHCMNRPFKDKSTYKRIMDNLKLLKDEMEEPVGAIQTTTRYSLTQYKEIVDQYLACGMSTLFIRPLTPLGFAKKSWEKIGYTAEEFLDFYKRSLDYIIKKALSGAEISEGHAMIFLRKIIAQEAGNYTELCSPCGAVRGQLAYYCDGNIYTCDEGRMLAEMGNPAFKVGTVEDSYQDLMSGEVCKTMCVASCLEAIPECHKCIYSPYCGSCPVINLALEGSIFVNKPNGYRCKIYKGMLDTLFEYLHENDEQIMALFKKWVY